MPARRNGRAPARRIIRNNAGFTVNSIIIAQGSSLETLTNGRAYNVTSITATTVKVRGSNRSYANKNFRAAFPATSSATLNHKFNMFLPKGPNRPYDFKVSVYPTGILKITAGCFTGTLAQAHRRVVLSGKPHAVKSEYKRTLTQIEAVATSLGIRLKEPKPVTVTVTLTPEEAVTLRTLIHMGVAGPTSSCRRHLTTIGSKLIAQNVEPSPQRLFQQHIVCIN